MSIIQKENSSVTCHLVFYFDILFKNSINSVIVTYINNATWRQHALVFRRNNIGMSYTTYFFSVHIKRRQISQERHQRRGKVRGYWVITITRSQSTPFFSLNYSAVEEYITFFSHVTLSDEIVPVFMEYIHLRLRNNIFLQNLGQYYSNK